jgi:hypothetical protein
MLIKNKKKDKVHHLNKMDHFNVTMAAKILVRTIFKNHDSIVWISMALDFHVSE